MIRIAMTALKGGAGVTAMVAGLAQAASREDLGVLCIDGDRQGTLKYHLGLVRMTGEDEDNTTHSRIMLRSPERAGERAADVMIWDVPRADNDVDNPVLETADLVVLVVPANAPSVTMVTSVRDFLSRGENHFLLINFDDGRIPLKRTTADYLNRTFGDRVLGRVRQDESIDEALANLELLSTAAPHSAAWTDIRGVLGNLLKRLETLPVANNGRA